MDYLSSDTLQKALGRMVEYPKYDVGMVFKEVSELKNFLLCMSEEKSWDVNFRSHKIKLDNGSSIKCIIHGNGRNNSLKFHEIIFHGDFSDTIIQNEYPRRLKAYILSENTDDEKGEKYNENALNDFLNEFNVCE